MGLFIILSLRGIGLDGRKAVYVRRKRSADDPDVVPAKPGGPASAKSTPKAVPAERGAAEAAAPEGH
jgi:hypothetical protein